MVSKKQNKKICKSCHCIFNDEVCPVCGGNSFADSYKGRVYIFDVKNSKISQEMDIKVKGEYAIKL